MNLVPQSWLLRVYAQHYHAVRNFGSNKGLVLQVGLSPGVKKAEKGNFLFLFSRLLLFITISNFEKNATES